MVNRKRRQRQRARTMDAWCGPTCAPSSMPALRNCVLHSKGHAWAEQLPCETAAWRMAWQSALEAGKRRRGGTQLLLGRLRNETLQPPSSVSS